MLDSQNAQRMYAEQVRQLYLSARFTAISTVLISSIFIYALWDESDHRMLILWYIGIVTVYAGRAWLARKYLLINPSIEEAGRWGKLGVFGALIAGISWGLGGVLFFPPNSAEHQFIVVMIMLGISSAAAAVLSVVREAFLAFIIPVSLSLVLTYLLMGSKPYFLAAIIMSIGLFFFIKSENFIYKNIRQNIALRLAEADNQKVLVNAMERAEKASQAKSEFLSRMSHELRTPLNAILGFGQMLELDEEGFSLTQKENVKEILTAGQHLLNLINEVLDLSRIEAGKMEVSLETIDLDELLQHTLSLVCHQAEERGVSIEDHVSGNNLTVFCDVMRLQQVLLNLLSNAVKYNRDKGQVVIDARSDGNHLELSIRDQGRGLSQKEIDRLFVPFDRLNADRDVQGTGIGLVITRHLLELMGGRLEIESEPGIGSVFRVVLPRAAAEQAYT